jgi:hypothetical protein
MIDPQPRWVTQSIFGNRQGTLNQFQRALTIAFCYILRSALRRCKITCIFISFLFLPLLTIGEEALVSTLLLSAAPLPSLPLPPPSQRSRCLCSAALAAAPTSVINKG